MIELSLTVKLKSGGNVTLDVEWRNRLEPADRVFVVGMVSKMLDYTEDRPLATDPAAEVE